MAISYDLVRSVSAQLYERALKKIPEDTKEALRAAERSEHNDVARGTLRIMLQSADAAEARQHFVCSDSGVPVYYVGIGTGARLEGDIKRAFADGFDDLVATIQPRCSPT